MRVFILSYAAITGFTDAFVCSRGSGTSVQQRGIDIRLHAKTAKKKKKKKTGASSPGGFGKVTVDEENETDDYSVFPALEQDVAQTLVPSTPETQKEPGELSAEIYDRLNQIYGFPNFNYETYDDKKPSEVANTEAKMTDTDFANLLSSAITGEAMPTSSSDASLPNIDSRIDSISELPPFTKMRVLHVDPLVIAVDDFFTEEECDRYVTMSTAPSSGTNDSPFQTKSMTVGKDALAKSQRTSTTWFHHYKSVPELIAKASRLLGLPGIDQWEEPQTVRYVCNFKARESKVVVAYHYVLQLVSRYRRQEKFTWHLDALSPSEAGPERGGQRIATLLVYLTDLDTTEGGATMFRDLSAGGTMLKV